MDPILQEGNMAGKIFCPNDKCKAKLGNYDWAGVACGCREWVTPVSRLASWFFILYTEQSLQFQGFCISRSKVDETV